VASAVAKRWLARVIFWFLGRGFCAAAALDSRIQAEMASWEDGSRIAMKVEPDGPALTVQKRGRRLVFLGLREAPDATLAIYYKHINSALMVLTGRIGIAPAFVERRMTMRGDIAFALSVVRCMLLVETYLFPRWLVRTLMQRVPDKEVSSLRVYLRALFAGHGA
jgi:hypothetical protein